MFLSLDSITLPLLIKKGLLMNNTKLNPYENTPILKDSRDMYFKGIKLAGVCERCKGEGVDETPDAVLGIVSCGECDGTGLALTKEGNELLGFIGKYLKLR